MSQLALAVDAARSIVVALAPLSPRLRAAVLVFVQALMADEPSVEHFIRTTRKP
jgi:hypothetical protein